MCLNLIKEFFVGDPVKAGAQSKTDGNRDDKRVCTSKDRNNSPYANLVGRLKYYGDLNSAESSSDNRLKPPGR